MEKKSIASRFKHGWNAFMNKDPTVNYEEDYDLGIGHGTRPDRLTARLTSERSVMAPIYNKIAMDVADYTIQHVRLDEKGFFKEVIDSGLNYCLNVEANIDQTSKAFIRDVVISMFEEGNVAIVPIDTDKDPELSDSYVIHTMRTGKIVQWYPYKVKVNAYDERSGKRKDIIMPKSDVAIIENPFYLIMNELNSTLRRLTRKLYLLDIVDEQSSSGKLDLIIQLPYSARNELTRSRANSRRKEIEDQLVGSKYGIAYMDGTERITQLNRPVENNLLKQVEYLTSMLYSQIGLSQSVFDGTANESTLNNYYRSAVEPCVDAIARGMYRTFLSKTARSQRQSIYYFRDPLKFLPMSQVAEAADKLTRNEIMSTNEVRSGIGLKASSDPAADELRNKNMPIQDERVQSTNNQNGGTVDEQQSET